MIVTLEKLTGGLKTLRVRVNGSTVRVKEDGRKEETTRFDSRDQAIEQLESSIERRTRQRGDDVAMLAFQLLGCSTDNRDGSHLLVGSSDTHAWNVALLDVETGRVTTYLTAGDPEPLDSHAGFFDFFQYEWTELPQRLFDTKHRLCGDEPPNVE